MARESYATLQAKIEKEISKLQKKAEVLHTKRRKPVIASIVISMREYQISPEEIASAFGTAKSAGRGAPRKKVAAAKSPAAKSEVKHPVAPKYRHPDSGETWSGRGKAPRWLAAEETKGKTRDAFLIK